MKKKINIGKIVIKSNKNGPYKLCLIISENFV